MPAAISHPATSADRGDLILSWATSATPPPGCGPERRVATWFLEFSHARVRGLFAFQISVMAQTCAAAAMSAHAPRCLSSDRALIVATRVADVGTCAV